ncbi:B12-binding domain-containing radical SAM protein [Pseudomonadota bacterium]
MNKNTFYIILIRPSHYDDEGYVIQWQRSFVPSNSLAVLYGLCRDVAEREALGNNTEIVLTAMDETNTRIPVDRIIRQLSGSPNSGLVAFVGVQTNQFPRAMDMATRMRRSGLQVCIGGFHVSGCISMLSEAPPDLQHALDIGISLFAGEAEGRMETVIRDAYHGQLQPMYNHLADLPALASQPAPFLPADVLQRSLASTSFDAGRGCPFLCSFCTIINVQGRQSRFRSDDDIEKIIRENRAQNIHRFLITDDNFSRNRDWEKIFDRIIMLREKEGIAIRLILQVDAMCHRIPGFIEKASRAGVGMVFIGLESINKETLIATGKRQNSFSEYRITLQAWRNAKVMTTVGYIIGFPEDTVASFSRDIDLLQSELPIDFLQLSYLTPLPGSEDHKKMHESGSWMDPDMNRYDLNHITTLHPEMSKDELEQSHINALDSFYSDEQVEVRLRRAWANGMPLYRIATVNLWYIACRLESVSCPDGGIFRRKQRLDRRLGLPIESPFIFYPKRIAETLRIYSKLAVLALKYWRICRAIKNDPDAAQYSDAALSADVGVQHKQTKKINLQAR